MPPPRAVAPAAIAAAIVLLAGLLYAGGYREQYYTLAERWGAAPFRTPFLDMQGVTSPVEELPTANAVLVRLAGHVWAIDADGETIQWSAALSMLPKYHRCPKLIRKIKDDVGLAARPSRTHTGSTRTTSLRIGSGSTNGTSGGHSSRDPRAKERPPALQVPLQVIPSHRHLLNQHSRKQFQI